MRKELRPVFVSLFVSLFCTPSGLHADTWSLPKVTEYESPTRKHALRVTPDAGYPDRMGRCLAELFKIDGDQRNLVWTRYLVNNLAPVDAMVTDSGKYVVTLDEWGHLGTLPVVIYGWHGQLIEVHSLKSLGVGMHRVVDGREFHILFSVSSILVAG